MSHPMFPILDTGAIQTFNVRQRIETEQMNVALPERVYPPFVQAVSAYFASMQFESREGYKAWRTEWKHCYAMLTRESRDAKHLRKQPQNRTRKIIFENARDVQHLRDLAYIMLHIRKESKEKAQAQWKAQRVAEAT